MNYSNRGCNPMIMTWAGFLTANNNTQITFEASHCTRHYFLTGEDDLRNSRFTSFLLSLLHGPFLSPQISQSPPQGWNAQARFDQAIFLLAPFLACREQ